MSIEWVNQAIDDLRAWGRAREVEVDADEVRLLCDYASDYLNVNELGDFTPETFDELLLSIYPRKVDRKSTRQNSSHYRESRMPSSA